MWRIWNDVAEEMIFRLKSEECVEVKVGVGVVRQRTGEHS